MTDIKKVGTRIFFGLWLAFFCVHFVFGSRGLIHGWRLARHNGLLVGQAQVLQGEITSLRQQVHAWQHDQFYVHQLAREHLQLAGSGETVYYVVE